MNKTQIIETLKASIVEAIESMTPPLGRREYNPHTVKVRENLKAALAETLEEIPEPHPLDAAMISADGKLRHYYGADGSIRNH